MTARAHFCEKGISRRRSDRSSVLRRVRRSVDRHLVVMLEAGYSVSAVPPARDQKLVVGVPPVNWRAIFGSASSAELLREAQVFTLESGSIRL